MFIGVDVGGTNTDAVILHSNLVVCSDKVVTSPDVTSGLERERERERAVTTSPYVTPVERKRDRER